MEVFSHPKMGGFPAVPFKRQNWYTLVTVSRAVSKGLLRSCCCGVDEGEASCSDVLGNRLLQAPRFPGKWQGSLQSVVLHWVCGCADMGSTHRHTFSFLLLFRSCVRYCFPCIECIEGDCIQACVTAPLLARPLPSSLQVPPMSPRTHVFLSDAQ